MPIVTPYGIGGTIFDIDGTTGYNAASVAFYNSTKKRWMKGGPVATGTNGTYDIDLSNIVGGYDVGDVVYISAWVQKESATVMSMSRRYVIVSGGSEEGFNLTLHDGPIGFSDCKITGFSATNAGVTNKGDCEVRALDTDTRISRLVIPATDSANAGIGPEGVFCPGGFVVLYNSNVAAATNHDSGGSIQRNITIKRGR